MMRQALSSLVFVFLLFALCTTLPHGFGQGIGENIDFRTIRVDELSDQQVRQFVERARTTGMTMQQLESEALRRGMPQTEVMKLRNRIATLGDATSATPPATQETLRTAPEGQQLPPTLPQMQDTITILRPFGHHIFSGKTVSFEPSFNIPTPRNYVLGAGDVLLVEVWGASQQSYSLTVSPEGQVNISNIGPIRVGGLTMEEAEQTIIRRLSGIYSGMRGAQANTFAQVMLGNVRSIKVTVAGDAQIPGTYTLPAFATAFNVLYLAGGPAESGSMRNIRVVRQNNTVAHIDLYDFLLRGDMKSNIRLQDEDLIFIGPVEKPVTIDGEINRPAIYELKETETLADLIGFAAGFSPAAYTLRLQVERKTDNKRQLLNVEKELFSSFLMKSGDHIEVGQVLEIFENRVSVQGAVYREGDYALTEGMTLKQLIGRAEGLREDAFTGRAAIYRLDGNRQPEVMDIDLGAILSGTVADIVLQREDLLVVSSLDELKEEKIIHITGEVLQPGSIPWGRNISLGEAIRSAGGFREAASLARVEVARRISNRNATAPGQQLTQIYSFPVNEKLLIADEGASFVLEPFDVIFVRRSPGYQTQQIVRVMGEVAFPGSYAISRKNEFLSDIIKRAGGLTPDAYIPGARLIRQTEAGREERLQMLRLPDREGMDTTLILDSENKQQFVGINLQRILENPGSRHDLLLMEGDILEIPKLLQTVRMSGAVLYPTTAIYQPNRGVRGYVSRAGGFSDNARKNKVYVLHPNGSVDRTRNYLVFRNYPSIEPGSEIIVPEKPQREGRSLQETIAISSALTSLALVVVTIIGKL